MRRVKSTPVPCIPAGSPAVKSQPKKAKTPSSQRSKGLPHELEKENTTTGAKKRGVLVL